MITKQRMSLLIFLIFPILKTFTLKQKYQEKKNTEWEKIATGKELKYTISNLSPGDYTLRVRVLISADGKYEEKVIHFKIQPLLSDLAFQSVCVHYYPYYHHHYRSVNHEFSQDKK